MSLTLQQALDRQASLTVGCEDCPAGVGEVCKRWDWKSGTWVELAHAAAHVPRLIAAGVELAPTDAKELRRG